MLLETDPWALGVFLDKLIFESDLSGRHLTAARYEIGLPNPVWSHLNSDKGLHGMETLTELLQQKTARR